MDLTYETKFHRGVRLMHRFGLSDAPKWAKDATKTCSVWVLELECGHVVCPIVGGKPPARIHCRVCAGKNRGYRK